MTIFLETPRLILRQFTQDDADKLFILDSDPDVMRFISGGIGSSYETITQHFLPDVLGYYEQYDNLGFWAINEKSSQEFIGWVVLRPEARFRFAQLLGVVEFDAMELGYRLRQISWGKGYATEVSRLLVNKAFTEWNFTKIIAWALSENKASIKVMKKLGMTLQQEYVLTAADVLPDVKLLENPVIQNILDKKLVKYQLTSD
ncbi:Acetyltransferase [Hyella patelloides LEGE 07179]|uniref:Acetyltransferase n=1 Tax=Hyella patelloides LEGE 07179 TaxID=945734 RepID=A0A563VQP0_9CYAN|nr:GNAT family N-acetyltransferase [Hyella patelloides]VEP13699.1 Acetyltransferase [Hyella patelloides LEGE 07179]